MVNKKNWITYNFSTNSDMMKFTTIAKEKSKPCKIKKIENGYEVKIYATDRWRRFFNNVEKEIIK